MGAGVCASSAYGQSAAVPPSARRVAVGLVVGLELGARSWSPWESILPEEVLRVPPRWCRSRRHAHSSPRQVTGGGCSSRSTSTSTPTPPRGPRTGGRTSPGGWSTPTPSHCESARRVSRTSCPCLCDLPDGSQRQHPRQGRMNGLGSSVQEFRRLAGRRAPENRMELRT